MFVQLGQIGYVKLIKETIVRSAIILGLGSNKALYLGIKSLTRAFVELG